MKTAIIIILAVVFNFQLFKDSVKADLKAGRAEFERIVSRQTPTR